MSTRSNGRPEPEVIVNYADGYAYSKGKMEEAFRSGLLDGKPVPKSLKDSGSRREDIDLLVQELEITRSQAEKLLAERNGDVSKTLEDWVTPKF